MEKLKKKKLYIETQGCQMNVYDSSRLADLLEISHDMEVTEAPEDADVLLVNTCSIREKAQEKVFSQLGRWNKLKKKNPNLVIGVGGCVASQEGAAIQKRAPYVDLIFGPQTLHRVPKMLKSDSSLVTKNITAVDVTFPELEKFDALPKPGIRGPEAFVSIMEGCNKYCSFCVVPYTRGEELSRPFESIMTEIYALAEGGVREVNLLGQNVNAYRGMNTQGQLLDFAALIIAVAAVPGIDRIRYTTSHPLEMTPSLIAVYKEVPELVSHLHLPVQSGSDAILQAMKRNHTADQYRATIKEIQAARPGISLSSDFIIGFPGETDSDFEQTMDLVQEIGFDFSFSFIYSKRPGTPAAQLADDTPTTVKQERLKRLQDQLKKQAKQYSEAMVGHVYTVLVSDLSRKNFNQLQGRTENNRICHFDSEDVSLIGEFVQLRITDAMPNSLRGVLTS